ncbi:hypothetical protein HAX54_034779 [Datura stramonium]|uniref:Uncharacterized protein n=1 Tax=Datura stramonium TaxID=4076 RepID=A0ABS8SEK4_DATST|nr:hypothetical protein [Datura stramonium]
MDEGKILPGEESFDRDSSDDQMTDDQPSSESEMDDDSSVTGESSDDDPVENKATVNIGKMHFIESIGQTIESIEKEMEELDLQLTKAVTLSCYSKDYRLP